LITVLAPAAKLMQRLPLLPKFLLVALAFLSPLLLVTLLLNHELHGAIERTQQQRAGAHYVRLLQKLVHLGQQHRALRHMYLTGNRNAHEKAQQTQAELNKRMAELDAAAKSAADHGMAAGWSAVMQSWTDLQNSLSNTSAKESYAGHTALIEQIGKLYRTVAEKSHLSFDSQADSYHLMFAFVYSYPGIAEGLAEIAGRGAAYIDTGLLEANEDVMLNSAVMVARRDLARMPAQLDAVTRENPWMRPRLDTQLAAVAGALGFLDRAQNEVLTSFNQTSGNQFFDAGDESIAALYASANASAALLEEVLLERIERHSQRRNLMFLAVLAALSVAAYLLAGFYASFSHEVKKLEKAVERAAAGDLANRLSSAANDEIGRLANALGVMNEGLSQLVAGVREGSESITHASHAISHGNAGLAAHIELQAASLQQTVISMEELTTAVKQNADHARQANQLVVSAAAVAAKGGEAVGQVVTTMGSIKESSRKIIDIIGVIDGLAFQTNLLALNAAVEAARAGEQGRGFVAVAVEVRALSQRSAVAAKEIKSLIENSVTEVNTGSKLVDSAGTTMREIVASVQEVARIMSEISAASAEQTAGIEQISEAVNQIDAISRQNAVLVEQASTSAEFLGDQAHKLSQAVAVFRLSETQITAVAAAPAPPSGKANVTPLRAKPGSLAAVTVGNRLPGSSGSGMIESACFDDKHGKRRA
jgi:methyl-accepting chemotaxis protein